MDKQPKSKEKYKYTECGKWAGIIEKAKQTTFIYTHKDALTQSFLLFCALFMYHFFLIYVAAAFFLFTILP